MGNVIERQPLNWSRFNPAAESAYERVQLHGANDLSKPIQGVFNDDPVLAAQEAWARAQRLGVQPVTQGTRDVYTVPMGELWVGRAAAQEPGGS